MSANASCNDCSESVPRFARRIASKAGAKNFLSDFVRGSEAVIEIKNKSLLILVLHTDRFLRTTGMFLG